MTNRLVWAKHRNSIGRGVRASGQKKSNQFRAMTCKKCGSTGYARHGSETSKTGICPDCRGNDE